MENSTGGKEQRRKQKVLQVSYYMPEGSMSCLAAEHRVLNIHIYIYSGRRGKCKKINFLKKHI